MHGRVGYPAPVIAAALAGLATVAGCASGSGQGNPAGATRPVPTAQLAGGQWDVTMLNGRPVLPNVAINLTFADGRVFGAGSCNRIMGGYKAGDDFRIELGQIASTMMACPEPQMAQEQLFLNILGDVNRFQIGPDGTLTLSTGDGRTITAQRARA